MWMAVKQARISGWSEKQTAKIREPQHWKNTEGPVSCKPKSHLTRQQGGLLVLFD